jgi:PAT family beta-lactamase induction signal transducer AmpG
MASMISGAISDAWGYEKFFFWVLLSTIPAFLVSALVPLKKSDTKSEQ